MKASQAIAIMNEIDSDHKNVEFLKAVLKDCLTDKGAAAYRNSEYAFRRLDAINESVTAALLVVGVLDGKTTKTLDKTASEVARLYGPLFGTAPDLFRQRNELLSSLTRLMEMHDDAVFVCGEDDATKAADALHQARNIIFQIESEASL